MDDWKTIRFSIYAKDGLVQIEAIGETGTLMTLALDHHISAPKLVEELQETMKVASLQAERMTA